MRMLSMLVIGGALLAAPAAGQSLNGADDPFLGSAAVGAPPPIGLRDMQPLTPAPNAPIFGIAEMPGPQSSKIKMEVSPDGTRLSVSFIGETVQTDPDAPSSGTFYPVGGEAYFGTLTTTDTPDQTIGVGAFHVRR